MQKVASPTQAQNITSTFNLSKLHEPREAVNTYAHINGTLYQFQTSTDKPTNQQTNKTHKKGKNKKTREKKNNKRKKVHYEKKKPPIGYTY